jgi:hypothetical protein
MPLALRAAAIRNPVHASLLWGVSQCTFLQAPGSREAALVASGSEFRPEKFRAIFVIRLKGFVRGSDQSHPG